MGGLIGLERDEVSGSLRQKKFRRGFLGGGF